MADRTVKLIITGDSTGAVKALAETGVASDTAAAKIEGGSGRIGQAFSKLGSMAANMGIPFGAAMSEMGTKMGEAEGHSSGLAGKLGALGPPLLVVGAAAVAVGAEAFDLATKMQVADAAIAAHAGISTGAAQQIGEAFLDTAGKSTFSGQQMAQAYAPVAGQLGQVQGSALSAGQALTVMNAATDLAEASGGDLGTTTQTLASVMESYGIKASGAASASNTLWNVSKLTGTGLDEVGTTVDKLHSKLGQATPSLADTGTLMVALAQHGATGTKGTQVLTTGMDTLLGGSKPVNEELKAMGVNVFDSSGKFVGMKSIIGQLQPVLAGMSQAQQFAAEKTLFGASAAQTMGQVILGGVSAFNQASQAVQKHGSVQAAATTQSSTLEGETKTLKATVIDLGTKLGEKLIPPLLKLATVVADVVGWFMRHKAAAEILAGAIGLIVMPTVAVGVAAALLAAKWHTIWNAMKETFDDVWGAMKDTFDAVWAAMKASFREMVDTILGVVEHLLDLASHLPFVGGKFKDAENSVKSFQSTLDASLSDAVGQMTLAGQAVDAFNQKAAALGSSLREVNTGAAGILTTGGGMPKLGAQMMAAGGVVNRPTLIIAGEQGPEAIVPLTDPTAAANVIAQAGLAGYSAGIGPGAAAGSGTATTGAAGVTYAPTYHMPIQGGIDQQTLAQLRAMLAQHDADFVRAVQGGFRNLPRSA